MKPEDYRKVVKFCDKGKCKVRENSFGVCWCGKLHSDAAEKLKPEEQIIVRNESNSCLFTELFANFYRQKKYHRRNTFRRRNGKVDARIC